MPEEASIESIPTYPDLAGKVAVVTGAGVGFGNVTNELGTEAVLRYIASRPDWYWPSVYLGFILGTLLWVYALTALAGSLTRGGGWALGQLGRASIIAGAAVHVVDSAISGFGLAHLAGTWAANLGGRPQPGGRPAARWRRATLDTGRHVGERAQSLPRPSLCALRARGRARPELPGLARVARLRRGPRLARLRDGDVSRPRPRPRVVIVFALVVSAFMLVLGAFMWRRRAVQIGDSPLGGEQMATNV